MKNARPDRNGGGIYFLDVQERQARELEVAFPSLAPDGSDFVPGAAVNPPGADESQARQFNLQEMATSQQIAAAVALKELGYEVKVSADGALILATGPGTPADGKLVPGDVIVSVDGQRVRTTRPGPRAAAPSQAGGRGRGRGPQRRGAAHGHPEDDRRPAGPLGSDRRRPPPAGRTHQAAVPGHDRHGQHRRPLGRARVRARGDGEARARRRPRLQGGGDRRDRSSTARSARSAASKQKTIGARQSRVWTSSSCPAGDNARSAQTLRRIELRDHPCEEFSTGVARTGNAAAEALIDGPHGGSHEAPGNRATFSCADPLASPRASGLVCACFRLRHD